MQVNHIGLEIDPNNYCNVLFQNIGNGKFTDVTNSSGLNPYLGNANSAVFSNFDNDGDLDIYVVYTGWIFNEANRLFENHVQGHFADVAPLANAQALVEGRGNQSYQ